MRKSRSPFSLIMLCISFITQYSFSEALIRLDTTATCQCVTTEVLHSDSHSYDIRMKMHFLKDEIVDVSGIEYHKISIEGQSFLENLGEPALPIITKHIGIPIGAGASVSITENQWTNIEIGRIFPAQNYKNDNDDTHFNVSESIYANNFYTQQMLTISENTVWKGIENVYVTVCPFKYYPSQNVISVLTDFTLHVSFVPNRNVPTEPAIYKEHDLKHFDNDNFIDTNHFANCFRSISDTIPNYLIIVGNIPSVINSQEMNDFCKWKALKGYRTKVVSTQIAGTDSASIKNYITQQVANGIEQVLFVGDQQTIPIPSIIPHLIDTLYPRMYSDYWYGCLGGDDDVQADVPIGRFIVESLSDFRNMVQKTIMYESCSYPFSPNVLLFAHSQHDYKAYYLNALEYIRTTPYADTMTYFTAYAASPEYGGSNASANDVYYLMNEGMNIVTYNGHSNNNNIWLDTENLLPGQIDYISAEDTWRIDSNRFFVFVSTGCLNGNFVGPYYSMMRSYVQSDHCAIAYLGDTYPMYTSSADNYLKRFYYRLLNNLDSHLGHLNLHAHLDIMGNSSAAITNAFGYICAGDPTLELWTGIQNTFQNVSISLVQDSIMVYVGNVDDYKINVANENGAYIGSYISSAGVCKIPASIGIWDMAIVKHNYIPYVIHIDTNSNYIQNVTISGNAYYYGTPLNIGNDVTTTISYGDVTIEPDAKVHIKTGNGITIKNGFNCKIGAELTIE